jgi:predicted  nucleic acid-binding Zn-ribbon protein
MSRLDLAEKRLTVALEKLEKAAQTAAQQNKLQPSLDALTEERDRLLTRIAQLEDELSALSSASQEVEGRLDGAIGEIRAALAR